MVNIIYEKMKRFLTDSLGISEDIILPETMLFQLGIDSVMMITVVNEINNKFGIALSLSEITFKYNTIQLICEFISSKQSNVIETSKNDIDEEETIDETIDMNAIDVEEVREHENSIHQVIENTKRNATYSNEIYNVLIQQKDTMETVFLKQLEVLKQITGNQMNDVTGNQKDVITGNYNNVVIGKQNSAVTANPSETVTTNKKTKGTNPIVKKESSSNVPAQSLENGATNTIRIDRGKELSKKQQRMLNELIQSITSKTINSKELAGKYRKYLADLDEIAGFSLLLKELHYQISVERGSGSKMVDVDGNEYVDIAMGFGSLLFGHSPDFVIDAVKNEVERGLQLAPRHRLVGEVAKLVCELTGFDRANFTVTGTEAVMTALKLARTYTGKNKIAIFSGGYHGHNDATLITKITKDGDTRPIAPGISKEAMKDMVILDYNDLNSIQRIKELKNELAAVIIEPVQSRRPENQPVEFLKAVRKVTEENGVLMIFDEIITGFRCNTGGAKQLFGIEPDMATYGKAACNGMPIGIVAGKEKVMDVADGGQWQYGDDSYPKVEQTFYAGTFFKHPFTMAAAHAILSFYKKDKNELQNRLAEKTANLAAELNRIFIKYHAPIEVNNFTSLFKFKALDEFSYIDIFYYKLLDYGIFTWEGRTCFLSAAHTDEDIIKIIKTVEKVVADMAEAEFFIKEDTVTGFLKNVPDEFYYE